MISISLEGVCGEDDFKYPGGVRLLEPYDFKGNLLQSQRQLARQYKTTLDWQATPGLEQGTFISTTTYDALNRPTSVAATDNSMYRPTSNEANLLEKVYVNLHGAPAATSFVTNIDYNAKGRREHIGQASRPPTTWDDQFRVHLPQPGMGRPCAVTGKSTGTMG